MRLLVMLICFSLSACAVQRPSVNQNALYSTQRGAVNIGSNPQVTEMRMIRGELWIY